MHTFKYTHVQFSLPSALVNVQLNEAELNEALVTHTLPFRSSYYDCEVQLCRPTFDQTM